MEIQKVWKWENCSFYCHFEFFEQIFRSLDYCWTYSCNQYYRQSSTIMCVLFRNAVEYETKISGAIMVARLWFQHQQQVLHNPTETRINWVHRGCCSLTRKFSEYWKRKNIIKVWRPIRSRSPNLLCEMWRWMPFDMGFGCPEIFVKIWNVPWECADYRLSRLFGCFSSPFLVYPHPICER